MTTSTTIIAFIIVVMITIMMSDIRFHLCLVSLAGHKLCYREGVCSAEGAAW